jgi:NADH-ubiquinone oxidoreductase chain 5
MIFVCGLSQYSVGIFHLSNHAFFKALLFLSAGSIIHAVQDEQDMRKMGGLKNLLPFTYSMMLIGSLALIGFPFLSGFYSKDLVLEIALSNYNVFGQFAYLLGTVGAFLTAFYSTRLLYLTFLIKPLGYKKILWNAVDSGNNITFVLGCLAVPSIFIGYFTKEMFVGIGNCLFNNVIFFKYNHTCLFDAEFMSYNQNMFFLDNVSLLLKLLPVLLSLLGVMSAIVLYKFSFKNLINLKISKSGRKIYQFLNKKWFFDKIYNELLGQTFFKFGYSLSYKFIDKGIFEMLGPTGISLIIYKLACNVHKLQTNSIYHCTLSILISSTFLIGFRQVLLYTYTFNILNFAIIILLIFFLMEFNNNKIYF